jgi:hypothetical protein
MPMLRLLIRLTATPLPACACAAAKVPYRRLLQARP